jgi:VanZ family protein
MSVKVITLKMKCIAWLGVVIWMGVIFAFSNQAHSGEITGQYLGPFNVVVRKTGHLSEYAILFFLLRRAFLCTVHGGISSFVMPFAVAVLFAISDEYHQSFVAGRSSSASDVVVDSIGALIGFGLIRLWLRFSKCRNN